MIELFKFSKAGCAIMYWQCTTSYGTYYDYKTMQQAENDVAATLGEETPLQENQSIRDKLRRATKQQTQPPKSKEREQERRYTAPESRSGNM